METNKSHPTTIDEYIAQFPEDVLHILVKIRTLIKELAPDAVEKISYQMPSFYLNGMLVWFAGHEHYIGFYPTGSGIEAFKVEISAYALVSSVSRDWTVRVRVSTRLPRLLTCSLVLTVLYATTPMFATIRMAIRITTQLAVALLGLLP